MEVTFIMLYICREFKNKTMKNLTETQELWLEKMTAEYGMTREQAINYLYYNA